MRGLGTARNILNKLTKVFERSLLRGCHHAFQHVPSLVKELYQWTVRVTQEVATSLATPCQIFFSCDANCFCKLHAASNETLSLQLRIPTRPTEIFSKPSPRSLEKMFPLTLEKQPSHLCLRKVGFRRLWAWWRRTSLSISLPWKWHHSHSWNSLLSLIAEAWNQQQACLVFKHLHETPDKFATLPWILFATYATSPLHIALMVGVLDSWKSTVSTKVEKVGCSSSELSANMLQHASTPTSHVALTDVVTPTLCMKFPHLNGRFSRDRIRWLTFWCLTFFAVNWHETGWNARFIKKNDFADLDRNVLIQSFRSKCLQTYRISHPNFTEVFDNLNEGSRLQYKPGFHRN